MTNPTTNFGWVMPTATDLVTDLPADFNVFGQGVDTSMADLLGGTTGQILSKTSATDMDFTWIANDQGDITGVTAGTGITVTNPTGPVPTVAINTAVTADLTTAQTLTNKTLTSPALTTPTISTLTTNGDLLYGTGSGALARRGIGSTGNVLTVSGGLPVWSAPAGGGKVLQVVSATTTTSTTIASLTLTDTTLTATITPTLATSKIMVFITQNVYILRTGSEQGAGMVLYRDATSIFDMNQSGIGASFFSGTGVTALETRHMVSVSYLDSPATTSATTYKTQGRVELITNSGGSTYQNGSRPSTITLMEIGA